MCSYGKPSIGFEKGLRDNPLISVHEFQPPNKNPACLPMLAYNLSDTSWYTLLIRLYSRKILLSLLINFPNKPIFAASLAVQKDSLYLFPTRFSIGFYDYFYIIMNAWQKRFQEAIFTEFGNFSTAQDPYPMPLFMLHSKFYFRKYHFL